MTARKPTSLEELAAWAVECATFAPVKQGMAARAEVPWEYVHAIRKLCDERGLDWRALKREKDAKRKAISQAAAAERARRYSGGAQ